MMTLEKYWTKNIENFLRGYTLFGPSKCGVSKNYHQNIAHDPTFLFQNSFLLKKCGCLQRIKDWNNTILPNYKGFKFEDNFSKNFLFPNWWTKNYVKHQVSNAFSNFWFYLVSIYVRSNIHTKGHKEASMGDYQDRHGKRSNLSADVFCQQSNFPQKIYL